MACDIRKAKGHTLQAIKDFYKDHDNIFVHDFSKTAAYEIEQKEFFYGAVFFATRPDTIVGGKTIDWAAYVQTHQKRLSGAGSNAARVRHLATRLNPSKRESIPELDDFRDFITVLERYAIEQGCTAIATKILVRSPWTDLFSQLKNYHIVAHELPSRGELHATFERPLPLGFRGDASEWTSLVAWYLAFAFGSASRDLNGALLNFRAHPAEHVDFVLSAPEMKELDQDIAKPAELPVRLICRPPHSGAITASSRFTIFAQEADLRPGEEPSGVDKTISKRDILGILYAMRSRVVDTLQIQIDTSVAGGKLLPAWHLAKLLPESDQRDGLVVEMDRQSYVQLLERLIAGKITDYFYFFNDGHFSRKAKAGSRVFFYVWDAPLGPWLKAAGQDDHRKRGLICAVANLKVAAPCRQSDIFVEGTDGTKDWRPGKGDDYRNHAIFDKPGFITRFFEGDVVALQVNNFIAFQLANLDDKDESYLGVRYDHFVQIIFEDWQNMTSIQQEKAKKLLPEWEVGNTYLNQNQAKELEKKLQEALGTQKKPWLAPEAGLSRSSKLDRFVSRSSRKRRAADKIIILFLAANPFDTNALDLALEVRHIKEKIRASKYRETLQFETEWAVRPDDLIQSLNEHRPHIVHFSGHGSSAGEIILLDINGAPKPVSKEVLVNLFRTFKENIRIVLLNACFSQPLAEAITDVIDCTIGMAGTIDDTPAITFAGSFYRGIGFGHSAKKAFDEGIAALYLDHESGAAGIPQLMTRETVEAESVILIEPTERRAR